MPPTKLSVHLRLDVESVLTHLKANIGSTIYIFHNCQTSLHAACHLLWAPSQHGPVALEKSSSRILVGTVELQCEQQLTSHSCCNYYTMHLASLRCYIVRFGITHQQSNQRRVNLTHETLMFHEGFGNVDSNEDHRIGANSCIKYSRHHWAR